MPLFIAGLASMFVSLPLFSAYKREMCIRDRSKLDEVAYIRFASVYRRFQDLNEFREEIERLALSLIHI